MDNVKLTSFRLELLHPCLIYEMLEMDLKLHSIRLFWIIQPSYLLFKQGVWDSVIIH